MSKPASQGSKQSEVAGCSREQAGDRYLVNSAGAQKLSRPVSPRTARCTKIKSSCSRRVEDFPFWVIRSVRNVIVGRGTKINPVQPPAVSPLVWHRVRTVALAASCRLLTLRLVHRCLGAQKLSRDCTRSSSLAASWPNNFVLVSRLPTPDSAAPKPFRDSWSCSVSAMRAERYGRGKDCCMQRL